MGDNLAGIIGGVLKAGAQTYSTVEQNKFARSQQDFLKAQQAAEKAQYDKYAAVTPEQDMKGIMALKQQMSAAMRNTIIRQITEQMASAGLSGSPGIIQEAIAEALAKAEVPLWQQASQNYYEGRRLPLSARPTVPIQGAAVKGPAGGDQGAFAGVIDAALKMFKPQPAQPQIPTSGNTVAGAYGAMDPLADPSAAGA